MIRFIFYMAFGYILLKLFRVFIDPILEPKTSGIRTPKSAPQPQAQPQAEKKSTLGDYVEFEEVK